MKKLLMVLILTLTVISTFSNTITVKQNGSGDYTSIQTAVNECVDGDSILVYPGLYYEHIEILNKSVSLVSLFAITQDNSMIDSTIIDGNETGRCIRIKNCDNVAIIGFSIRNGVAVNYNLYEADIGGGIFSVSVDNFLLSNCKIYNNVAMLGGGINIRYNNAILEGNSIFKNRGILYGGGAVFSGNTSTIEFSEEDLNNIYLNYAPTGSDIDCGGDFVETLHVVVDTFTVLNPDYFHITSGDYTFSCLHSKIEEVDSDLYVSPYGDDENSGLSPDNPLQTIAWAQTIIKRNNENPHTIHLAPGIYSPSLNNQIFPLNIKHGVTIEGVSPDSTILDAEGESNFVYQFYKRQSEFSLLRMKNFTMTNGSSILETFGSGIVIYQSNLYLEDVVMENLHGGIGTALLTGNGYVHFNRVEVRNNMGGKSLHNDIEYNCPNPILYSEYKNCKFYDNDPNPNDEYESGGAILIGGHSEIEGDYRGNIINCEISDNYCNFFNPQNGSGGVSGLSLLNNIEINLINCTLSDNKLYYSATGSVIGITNAELNIYNTIIYGNEGYNIVFLYQSMAQIYNSLFENGTNNIFSYNPESSTIYLNDETITDNPLFLGEGDYPYALSSLSPCIDAGTLDLPEGVELPETDLAGNPRVVGASVDMGAYEYQGNDESQENQIISPQKTEINIYPNPFELSRSGIKSSVKIRLNLKEAGKIKLVAYNIKGQKVKTLIDAYSGAGEFTCKWDVKSEHIVSGVYFIKLIQDGKTIKVKKMMVVK